MAPSLSPPYTNCHTQDEEHLYSTPLFRPANRRTPSFSSSSRSNSWGSYSDSPSSIFSLIEDNFPPYSPRISPPLKFKGIPFSWEQIPGIPKHKEEQLSGRHSGHHLLPLPPAGNSSTTTTTAKKLHYQEEISPKKSHHTSNYHRSFQKDPFLAALVECSKDDDDHGSNNVARSLTDRFGFMTMYMTSCKRTCAVSESIVYLPSRPSPHYLLNRRRSR